MEAAAKAVHASLGPWALSDVGPDRFWTSRGMTSAPCATQTFLGTLLASRAFAPLLGADQTGGREGAVHQCLTHRQQTRAAFAVAYLTLRFVRGDAARTQPLCIGS